LEKYVAELLKEQNGHFKFESGHHGTKWLELDLLFYHPEKIDPVVEELSGQIMKFTPEVVCRPFEEGAFLALLVALKLGISFTYASRSNNTFSNNYAIPNSQEKNYRERRWQ